jgi:uncharacterized protein (DUF1697 family)
MTAMVALLRGINVGGSSRLAMADLRAAVERCGHTSVRTYIQSGNVAFRAAEGVPDRVVVGLAEELAATTAVAPLVVVRTASEWTGVLARSEEPSHLHVMALASAQPEVLDGLDAAEYLPEEYHADGRHVYLLLQGEIGRSTLARPLARALGDVATIRNRRTATRLAGLFDELE